MSYMITVDDLPFLKDGEIQEFKDDKSGAIKAITIKAKHPTWDVELTNYVPETKFEYWKIGPVKPNVSRTTSSQNTPAGSEQA